MRTRLCILLALLTVMSMFSVSCHTSDTPDVSSDTLEETAAGTAEETEAVTDAPLPVLSETALYGDGKGIGALVGVDALGRTVNPVGERKAGKKIGMFYWIWHGTYTDGIIDTSKVIEEKGLAYALHNVNEYNPNNYPHWWGEPLFGYYNSADDYIIRKHLTLMMYMGVDFIVFDASNTITYPSTTRKICSIICELRGEGFNVPQISYYTHTASIQTVRQAYKEVYTTEAFRDAWYCLDGKPLMIAQTDPRKDVERTTGQHAHLADYDPGPLSDEIMDFFTFRTPAWVGQDQAGTDTWPWIDWCFPPERHGNLMCVSVSSHHWTKYSWMGNEALGERRPTAVWNFGRFAWGRGYDVSANRNVSEDAVKGTYYQSVWDSVIKADPEIAFVSGWNEWCCGVEYNADYQTYELYDSFNMEFSRDIEMMKGGYEDNFVLQTAANIRAFGYDAVTGAPAEYRPIDIDGPVSQWDDVPARYVFTGTKNYGRDSKGANASLHYETPAAVNGLQEVRVASDQANVYFLIRCDGDVTLGGSCLNLLIGTGRPSLKGWNGYEFLIGRVAEGGKLSVEQLGESFLTGTVTGYADCVVSGNCVQIRVPRGLIGLEEDSTFYFKCADSVEHPDDIMDYYVTGRCLPMGRFSYQFFGNKGDQG
ncbi:MAG: hypothetical protein MJ192_08165 [Clostridia bacterium]|nr:hypothetical protein [Clostridia bacterium]